MLLHKPNHSPEPPKRGSIAYDVDRTLAYGYNLSRMHIKENEPLWYYECDRRGLPVWTEHPGNFYATQDDPDPHDTDKAKAVWADLLTRCYPGSPYNCYHRSNGPHCVGEVTQRGAPILISEFLHTSGIDRQLRMYEKIAGYLRMNVASHEVENSGPLTAERFERDYGYLGHDLTPRGYDCVNRMDFLALDIGRITRVKPEQPITIPLYTSHFDPAERKNPVLHWSLAGIDSAGRICRGLAGGDRHIDFRPYCVQRQPDLQAALPAGMRGAYVTAWITDGEECVCENGAALVGDGAVDSGAIQLPVLSYREKHCDGDCGEYTREGRETLWMNGRSSVTYLLELQDDLHASALVLECAAHRTRNAVRVTDERMRRGEVKLFLDENLLAIVSPKEDSTDERAVFTNAELGGDPYDYFRLGSLGYGDRFQIPLKDNAVKRGKHILRVESGKGGMALFGQNMGRYGMGLGIIRDEDARVHKE